MKPIILPLGIKNRTKTELPALIALEAIGQPWFSENHRCDLLSIAMVAQLIAEEGSEIYNASCALISLLEPYDLSIDDIRPVVVEVNTWLQTQPNSRVQSAIDKLLRQQSRKPKTIASRPVVSTRGALAPIFGASSLQPAFSS